LLSQSRCHGYWIRPNRKWQWCCDAVRRSGSRRFWTTGKLSAELTFMVSSSALGLYAFRWKHALGVLSTTLPERSRSSKSYAKDLAADESFCRCSFSQSGAYAFGDTTQGG